MRIEALRLDSFAGLSNRQVDFAPGLNVLLGPNEAGKSTLVDAIFLTLFRDTSLGKNTKEYRDILRYMPYPHGKALRTAVTVTDGSREYVLEKEWGSQPRTDLQIDGRLLRDPSEIRAALQELLVFGEGTYDKIVFAKQRGFQDVLERLASDPEAASTLSGVLRQAVMELDGISVEGLKMRIENAYHDLADHWDQANQRPEGNRGIHNPWKVKIGKVLAKYYEKERLKYDLSEAWETEERYTRAAESLKEKTGKEKSLSEEIRVLSALESDMSKRASLETRLVALKKEFTKLQQVNQEYPVRKERIAQGRVEHKQLNDSLAAIVAELAQAEALAALAGDREILKKAEELERQIAGEALAVEQLAQYTDEVLRDLEQYQRQGREANVALAAARLKGTYLAGSQSLELEDGMGKIKTLKPGDEFAADGYFKMRLGSTAEIEVASGEIDYQHLIQRQQEAVVRIRAILQKLPADSVDTVRMQNERRKEKALHHGNLKRMLDELLKGRNRSEMQARVESMGDVTTRPRNELEKLRIETVTQITRLEGDLKANAQQLEQWEAEFGALDKIFEIAADTYTTIKEQTEELSSLPQLPSEFNDVGEFKMRLEQCRSEANLLAQELEAARSTYYGVKAELSAMESPEELAMRLQDAEAAFTAEQQHLTHLDQVREAFSATMAGMDQNTFAPLVQAFGKYLAVLTAGRYSTGQIQDTLAVRITRADGVHVPAALLSMGTYDCVSLAFRLAVLDHLFVEKPGLLVLDDCLVNMDEDRRAQAVRLIQAYAESNQVIFSTCNREVADVLGGNVILV